MKVSSDPCAQVSPQAIGSPILATAYPSMNVFDEPELTALDDCG